ncbi:hypothetical protein BD289DRAFT_132066 [Coniella lustricola]|uniref:Uncharacterized protein n=1 Tax=Coniella lustricola TaxID=2025994 RepID=A0A2T2ZVZ6_9PEZI|nr:hypothetical protein BD289DRAFT_132066 [Coniella lustricola]
MGYIGRIIRLVPGHTGLPLFVRAILILLSFLCLHHFCSSSSLSGSPRHLIMAHGFASRNSSHNDLHPGSRRLPGPQQLLNRPMAHTQMPQPGPLAQDSGSYSPFGQNQQQYQQGRLPPSPDQAPHPHPAMILDEVIRLVEEVDLTRQNLTEQDCAERQSTYHVFHIVKSKPQDRHDLDGTELKATWAKCERHPSLSIDQAKIRQEIRRLNKKDKEGKYPTLSKKQQSLGRNAYSQVKKAENDLAAKVGDKRFHVILEQLDWTKKPVSPKHSGRHSRSSRAHASKRSERALIIAYFKICPRPDQSARELYHQRQFEARQMRNGMQQVQQPSARAQQSRGQTNAARPTQPQIYHQQARFGSQEFHEPQVSFQQPLYFQAQQPEMGHQQPLRFQAQQHELVHQQQQSPQPQGPRQQQPLPKLRPLNQGRQGGFQQGDPIGTPPPPLHPHPSFSPTQNHKSSPLPRNPEFPPSRFQETPMHSRNPGHTTDGDLTQPPPDLAEPEHTHPANPPVAMNEHHHNRRHSGRSYNSSLNGSDWHPGSASNSNSTIITEPSLVDSSSPQMPHKLSGFPSMSQGAERFYLNETNGSVQQQTHRPKDRGEPKVYTMTGSDTKIRYAPPGKHENAPGANGLIDARDEYPISAGSSRDDRRRGDRNLERARRQQPSRSHALNRSPSPRGRSDGRDTLPQDHRRKEDSAVPLARVVPRSEVGRQRSLERRLHEDFDRLHLGGHGQDSSLHGAQQNAHSHEPQRRRGVVFAPVEVEDPMLVQEMLRRKDEFPPRKSSLMPRWTASPFVVRRERDSYYH